MRLPPPDLDTFAKVAVCKSDQYPGQMECQIRSKEGEVLIRAVAETGFKAVRRLRQLADALDAEAKNGPPDLPASPTAEDSASDAPPEGSEE